MSRVTRLPGLDMPIRMIVHGEPVGGHSAGVSPFTGGPSMPAVPGRSSLNQTLHGDIDRVVAATVPRPLYPFQRDVVFHCRTDHPVTPVSGIE